jgi:hypothetical protein
MVYQRRKKHLRSAELTFEIQSPSPKAPVISNLTSRMPMAT